MNSPVQTLLSRSLYVGNLGSDVTEYMIYEKFSSIGRLVSIHLCRNMITHRSLGYAYVNFQQHSDAVEALDKLNFDLIKGKPIRIMWCQCDQALRNSGVGIVLIKNVDAAINSKTLYDTFSAFGAILSCKIAQDENGQSKQYGYIHFATEAAANKAIEKVNGMVFNGETVCVSLILTRKERRNYGSENKCFANVYIKNFGDLLSETQLFAMFRNFGNITSINIVYDKNGKSKGYGFVAFDSQEAATKAVYALNNVEIAKGHTICVGLVQTKEEQLRRFGVIRNQRNLYKEGLNLYIKNLDNNIGDKQLRNIFSLYGKITSAKVMTEKGKSKGVGFVCYSSPQEATAALVQMNGRKVGSKYLYVTLAQTKSDSRNDLILKYTPDITSNFTLGSSYGSLGVSNDCFGPGFSLSHPYYRYIQKIVPNSRCFFPKSYNPNIHRSVSSCRSNNYITKGLQLPIVESRNQSLVKRTVGQELTNVQEGQFIEQGIINSGSINKYGYGKENQWYVPRA